MPPCMYEAMYVRKKSIFHFSKKAGLKCDCMKLAVLLNRRYPTPTTLTVLLERIQIIFVEKTILLNFELEIIYRENVYKFDFMMVRLWLEIIS